MLSQIIVLSNSSEVYKCGVYKVYHVISPNEIYVGSTTRINGRKGNIGFAVRFAGHYNSIKKGTHASKRLVDLSKRHGLDGLRMAIIEVCPPLIARDREQYYMDQLKPSLNQTASAYNSLGYKHTQHAKEVMSKMRKGSPLSKKARQNISKALKGKMPKNVSMLRTKEAREKVAKKLRGLKRNEETIQKMGTPIYQFTLHGELIKSHPTMSIAARSVKIDRASINHCALGNRSSAGGYLWSYSITPPAFYSDKFVVIQKNLSGEVVEVYGNVDSAAKTLGKTTTTAIRGAIQIKSRTAYGYAWEKMSYMEAIKIPALAKQLGLSESRLSKL